MSVELIGAIRDLGLDTSKMTFEEIAEVTGFSPFEVQKVLRKNSMPYVKRRITEDAVEVSERAVRRSGRLRGERPETFVRVQGKPVVLRPAYSRVESKFLSLGLDMSEMTVGEIAEAAGMSYLGVQRILLKHGIEHL